MAGLRVNPSRFAWMLVNGGGRSRAAGGAERGVGREATSQRAPTGVTGVDGRVAVGDGLRERVGDVAELEDDLVAREHAGDAFVETQSAILGTVQGEGQLGRLPRPGDT